MISFLKISINVIYRVFQNYRQNFTEHDTVRSKTKKIEIAMINTLQLAARKNLIQMSLQW
jgi:hypothetical protein